MGYPDGVKGWRLWDCTTRAFFNSRDIIFDEGSVMCQQDLSLDHRMLPMPSPSSSLVPSATDTAWIESLPPAEPHRSTRSRVLTEKGRALAEELQRMKDRLEMTHARDTLAPGTSEGVVGGIEVGSIEGVNGNTGEGVPDVEEEDETSPSGATHEGIPVSQDMTCQFLRQPMKRQ